MSGKRVVFTALILGLALGSSAAAQPQISMVGTWSGEAPGQGGMVHGADQYMPDGTYVSVMQLPNGSVERIWGSYVARQTSARQIQLSLRMRGLLPREICAQAPGFPIRCSPNRAPEATTLEVNFVSSSSVQVNGVTMTRDRGSPLLAMQPPQRLVLAARAPVAPQMRQPVMPAMHPYTTPTGPGSVQGMRADDQAQQYRICAVNGGQVIQLQGGGVRCVQ